jgi:hypothetical protein
MATFKRQILKCVNCDAEKLEMIGDGFKILHQGFLGGSCSAILLLFIRSSVER